MIIRFSKGYTFISVVRLCTSIFSEAYVTTSRHDNNEINIGRYGNGKLLNEGKTLV